MRVSRIALSGFRNYEWESFTFDPGTNVIRGKNGQGKTNLLVIFLPIHLLLSRVLQEELDSVEGFVQDFILLKPLLRRKVEGEIPIIYRRRKIFEESCP